MADLDLVRLARAVHLEVERLGRETWRVSGGQEPHIVARGGGGLTCDCTDADRGHTCKHELAVRLRYGDPRVLLALRELVRRPSRSGQATPPAAVSGPTGARR